MTRRLLVLYDATQSYTSTVFEHLQSLAALPGWAVHFCHARPDTAVPIAFEAFDIVVVHYSVRLAFDRLSPHDAAALAAFGGLKVLFIQDEYDYTERARAWIERLRLHVVFTCVPAAHLDRVYPPSRFPDVTFVSNLTGYVPATLTTRPRRPQADRPILIGYRGRHLPFWYGQLGQEKRRIGERMRAICDARGLVTDIESHDGARIYGDAWYAFLGRCRATLATESGSNVFDDTGDIRQRIAAYLAAHPNAAFEDVARRFLAVHETPGLMNQVSPKVFEAIALGTALVMFEGTYSGVVQPDRHFLPLRKDFSNVDDVLAALTDEARVTAMTERAYQDVIASGTWSCSAFTRLVGDTLDAAQRARSERLATATTAHDEALASAINRGAVTTSPHRAAPPPPTPPPVAAAVPSRLPPALRPLWLALPESMRTTVRPTARVLLRALGHRTP